MSEQNYEPKSETKIDKKKIVIAGIWLAGILIIFVILSSIVTSKVKKITTSNKEVQQEVASISRKKILDNTGYEGKKTTLLIEKEKNNTTIENQNSNQIKEIKTENNFKQIDENLEAYYEQLLQEELVARKSVIKFDDPEQTTTNNSFIPTTNSNTNSIIPPNFGNIMPQEDQNKIKEKKEFLRGTNEDKLSIYNQHEIVDPLSPYQVNAGNIIPGVFITGVKSTLPGRMIGQVRENVYDSVTGNYLLIPKGARIMGMYDSNVTFGQDRVMIIWERIIFPSGKSIELDRFVGTDLSGYAGVTGKVNNHYGKLLTSVVLSSIIGAGTAIVDNDNDNNDWKSEAGRGAGEQIINIGTKFADKVMNIAPEITIAPGQKFNIIVNSDMLLEPVE